MRVQGLQHALTWQRRGADLHRQAAGQASSRRDRSVPERRLQGQVKPAIAASPREMNVGWIGTGKLVLPMAARIAAALQSEGLEFEALRNYPICVALAPTHRFARLKSITLEKVAAEPLIGFRRKDYREYYVGLDRIFSPLGINPNPEVEAANTR